MYSPYPTKAVFTVAVMTNTADGSDGVTLNSKPLLSATRTQISLFDHFMFRVTGKQFVY